MTMRRSNIGYRNETVRVPVSQGRFALVDRRDYGRISQFKWTLLKRRGQTQYAYRKSSRRDPGGRKTVYMHREILGVLATVQVDHINHNGLDNRRSNLRVCDSRLNAANARKAGSTSRFRGVSWDKSRQKWAAQIRANGRKTNLGRFHNERSAAHAYNMAARREFGMFATLNRDEKGRIV